MNKRGGIIAYCNRPFKTIEEMNEKLIENWNSVVKPGNNVYHHGDFSFGTHKQTQEIVRRLNGNIHLILGNHDEGMLDIQGFASMQHYRELKIGKQLIVMFHFACRVWNKSHRGSIQTYGHSHNGLKGNSQSLDVGVDCWNYTPVNFEQIKERLKTLPTYVGYENTNGSPKAAHMYKDGQPK